MKNKQLLILPVVILLVVGTFLVVRMNDKKERINKNPEVASSQNIEKFDQSNQSIIEYSSETEVSYSSEKSTLSIEELQKYREDIEKAGFDSTLFSDQEVQEMFSEMTKKNQSIAEYLKNKPDKMIDENEINKARNELKEAKINPDKLHNNEIVELIKRASKENKSIVEVAGEQQ